MLSTDFRLSERAPYSALGHGQTIYHWLKQADKRMKLSATANNLKRWLICNEKRTKSGAGSLPGYFSALRAETETILSFLGSSFG